MKIESCCCLTLRQGSIFISFLALSSSIFFLLISGVNIVQLRTPYDSCGHKLREYFGHLVMSSVVYFCFSMSSIFLSSLLLHGIAKKKPSSMVPWLCAHFTSLFVFVSYILAWLFGGEYFIGDFSPVVMIHLFCLVFYTLHLYFFFVLYNYYKQLVREQSSKALKAPPGNMYLPGYPYGQTTMPNAPPEMINIPL